MLRLIAKTWFLRNASDSSPSASGNPLNLNGALHRAGLLIIRTATSVGKKFGDEAIEYYS